MSVYSEMKLYINQMTTLYISRKNISEALRLSMLVLPKDGSLYNRVDKCFQMITTGEDLPEENPLRSALSVIDDGEPALVIFHDLIVWAETTGRSDESIFMIYGEMISSIDNKENKDKGLRHKKDKCAGMYERLKKCRRKNVSKRLKKELIKELKNELILSMTSMTVYTRMMGVSQALKKTCTLTHGLVRTQLKSIRKRYEEGEDVSSLCMDFFGELELPELAQCLDHCFNGGVDWLALPMGSDLFLHDEIRYKRRIPGKEICAVLLAVVIGSMGIMGIVTKEDKKEGRLRNALSQSLMTAVGDMKDERGTNQIMAGFMQQMLKQVDDDIDLTVRICDLDELDQTMEVEAIGEYDSFLGDRRRISVRRRLSF